MINCNNKGLPHWQAFLVIIISEIILKQVLLLKFHRLRMFQTSQSSL